MSTEKPKPQDRRQIQLDLSDLAQIETQLNNSFWQNRKKKETMNQTVRISKKPKQVFRRKLGL